MYAVPPKKSKWWLAVLAALIVVGVGVGAVLGMQKGDQGPTSGPVTTTPVTTSKPLTKEPVGPVKDAVAAPVKPIELKEQGSGSAKPPGDGSAAVAALPPTKPETGETPKSPTVKANPSKSGGRPIKTNAAINVHKPPVHVPVVGEGSAKTVVVTPLQPPALPPGMRKCSIHELKPSGDWPTDCIQSQSK